MGWDAMTPLQTRAVLRKEPSCSGAGPRPPRRGGTASPPGLVSYETSPTEGRDVVAIHPHHARLARMRHGVMTSARLHTFGSQHGGFRVQAWMVTLTYAPGVEWAADHIRGYTKRVGAWCARQGVPFRYLWVAELQQRGAVHYHFLVWLPKRIQHPKPDKRGWWPHGITQREVAHHAISYIAKYSSKGTSDVADFPKGARIFACGGLRGRDRDEYRWWRLPRWAREQCNIEDRPYRCKQGGIVLRSSSRLLSSPWVVCSVSGGVVVVARRIEALL